MMRPPSRESMSRPAACANRNAPVRLMSTTFCHFSSGIASGSAAQVTPALLTRMSTLPKTATVLSTTACTSSALATSQRMPSTRNPRARIAATVGVSHSSRRAHSISAAPASASPSAISSPIPRDPPVTMATRSVSENNSLRVGTLSGLYFRAAGLSTMSISTETMTGGQFLTTAARTDEVFIREELTEEQRLFGRTALEFMQKEVLPVAERLYEHDWVLTRQLLKKASDLDLLRLEIPEAHGGLGLDLISAAYVGEQIAINPSFGGSLGAHTSIGTLPLVYFGSEALKAHYLPRLASGELIGAYALTEPQSGSDALAARTTATLTEDGRHYLLNGQKMWITNGGFADLFTIFAKVNGDQFTAFLVERGMGVVSGRDEIKLGLDGSSTTSLMLDNVKVPIENVLGTIGQGHKVAFNVLNFGRVKLGARNMSGVRTALNHAVRYAMERRQFGRAIAEFGLIKQKIAGMTVRAFIGDAMSYRTLGDVDRVLDAGDRTDGARVMKTIEGFSVECSINKVWTSEALAWAVDEALQVYGGNGYSREFPAERAYRDARITRIYEGTNEINRMIIPTRLWKAGGASLSDDETRPPSSGGPLAAERIVLARIKSLAIAML